MQSTRKSIFILVSSFTVGVGVLTAASLLVQHFKALVTPPVTPPSPIIQTVVLKPPSCVLNLDEYQKLVAATQTVHLVTNLNSFGVAGKFYNGRSISVIRSGNGEIGCGYLYIKAKVDDKGLDDKYDSIYINPQGLGGHILRSTGLVTSEKNETTVLLQLS